LAFGFSEGKAGLCVDCGGLYAPQLLLTPAAPRGRSGAGTTYGEGAGHIPSWLSGKHCRDRLRADLSRYHAEFPGVVVELVTGTTGALVNRVMSFDLEAAFVSEPSQRRNSNLPRIHGKIGPDHVEADRKNQERERPRTNYA